MAILPPGLFDIYNEICDDFIDDNFGVNCTIYYPPISVACDCQLDPIGQKTANRFQSGGLAPFQARDCSFCGGTGWKQQSSSETIKLRIYDQPRHWIKIAEFVNIPDADVQVIGYITDVPKISSSDYIILNSDQAVFGDFKYKLSSQCLPHGFKKNRYFIALMKKH